MSTIGGGHRKVAAPFSTARPAAPRLGGDEATTRPSRWLSPNPARSTATSIRPCPDTRVLLPYLDDYWREHVLRRGLERENYEPSSLPGQRADQRAVPTGSRPSGHAGSRPRRAAQRRRWTASGHALRHLQRAARRPGRSSARTCRPRSAAPSTTGSPPSGWTAIRGCAPPSSCRCTAPNSPPQEIERLAADQRFVQVLLLAMARTAARPPAALADLPRRREATACRSASMPAAAFATRRPTSAGRRIIWKTTSRSRTGFAAALNSLVTEGVFVEFPRPQGRADGIRRDLAAGLRCGGSTRPGAACAPRCRGWSSCRPRRRASMSA